LFQVAGHYQVHKAGRIRTGHLHLPFCGDVPEGHVVDETPVLLDHITKAIWHEHVVEYDVARRTRPVSGVEERRFIQGLIGDTKQHGTLLTLVTRRVPTGSGKL